MLPKKARLSAEELKAFFLSPRTSVRGAHFSFSCEKTLVSQGKIAVVVSKKLAGNAVKRNAIRRRMYRALVGAPLPPRRCVLFAEKSFQNKDFSEIREEILGLLAKVVR